MEVQTLSPLPPLPRRHEEQYRELSRIKDTPLLKAALLLYYASSVEVVTGEKTRYWLHTNATEVRALFYGDHDHPVQEVDPYDAYHLASRIMAEVDSPSGDEWPALLSEAILRFEGRYALWEEARQAALTKPHTAYEQWLRVLGRFHAIAFHDEEDPSSEQVEADYDEEAGDLYDMEHTPWEAWIEITRW